MKKIILLFTIFLFLNICYAIPTNSIWKTRLNPFTNTFDYYINPDNMCLADGTNCNFGNVSYNNGTFVDLYVSNSATFYNSVSCDRLTTNSDGLLICSDMDDYWDESELLNETLATKIYVDSEISSIDLSPYLYTNGTNSDDTITFKNIVVANIYGNETLTWNDTAWLNGDVFIKDIENQVHHLNFDLEEIDQLFSNVFLTHLDIETFSNSTGDYVNITAALDEPRIIVNLATATAAQNYRMDPSVILQLTSGTNESPILNRVYVRLVGGVATWGVSTTKPTFKHALASRILLGEHESIPYASALQEDGSNGNLKRIQRRFRKEGLLYEDGLGYNASATELIINNGSYILGVYDSDVLGILNTSIRFFDVHTDGSYHWHNHFSGLTEYSNGVTIGNNKYFNVVFGVIPFDGSGNVYAVVQDEPTTEYNSMLGAYADTFNTLSVYPSDDFLRINFLPVARMIINSQSNEAQILPQGSYAIDYRGGVAGGVSSGGGLAEIDPVWTADKPSYIPYNGATSNINLNGQSIYNLTQLTTENLNVSDETNLRTTFITVDSNSPTDENIALNISQIINNGEKGFGIYADTKIDAGIGTDDYTALFFNIEGDSAGSIIRGMNMNLRPSSALGIFPGYGYGTLINISLDDGATNYVWGHKVTNGITTGTGNMTAYEADISRTGNSWAFKAINGKSEFRDTKVKGTLNITNEIYAKNITLGAASTNDDIYIYFNDDALHDEYLKWDNSYDRFVLSDYLLVSADIASTGGITSNGFLSTNGDIVTTGANDDLWLGTSTQGNSVARLDADGTLYATTIGNTTHRYSWDDLNRSTDTSQFIINNTAQDHLEFTGNYTDKEKNIKMYIEEGVFIIE